MMRERERKGEGETGKEGREGMEGETGREGREGGGKEVA